VSQHEGVVARLLGRVAKGTAWGRLGLEFGLDPPLWSKLSDVVQRRGAAACPLAVPPAPGLSKERGWSIGGAMARGSSSRLRRRLTGVG
jgi:hypothetical protein